MPLILPGNVASATAAVTYDVANSCRFEFGDSPKMVKTLVTPTDATKFTISAWVKLGGTARFASNRTFWSSGSYIDFHIAEYIDFQSYDGSANPKLRTTRILRDPSAWYHLAVAVDSTQGTAGNRMKMYINGVQETVFATETQPAEDHSFAYAIGADDVMSIGIGAQYTNEYFDGYLAEVVFIDGLALAPTSFGEFDSDSPAIWKPIDVSGLTFGNNGFYLDFEDADNLGNDANGGTDFTESNLAATDQCTDTPTNNFCVMNHLDNYYEGATFAEGNCKVTTNSGSYAYSTSTFGLTAGKWYWEIEINAQSSTDLFIAGIAARPPTATNNYLGADADAWGIYAGIDGYTVGGSDTSDWCDNFTDDDIMMFGLDLDNNKLYAGLNGNWCDGDGNFDESDIGDADGIDITAVASLTSGAYFPVGGYRDTTGTATYEMNFGNPVTALSSAQSDDNDYGAFEFNPPTGYLSICTKNLGSDGG